MTYATASIVSVNSERESCSNCNDYLEPQAKFCGSCGFIVAPSSFNIRQYPEQARLVSIEPVEDELEVQDPGAGIAAGVMPVPAYTVPLPVYENNAANIVSQVEAVAGASVAIPSFALPSQPRHPKATELTEEGRKIRLLLARERLFLYFLIGTFLSINLFGCWVAWTCYTGFLGDEVSKTVMAMTPFLFINLVALVVIVPIKGTRREIARLKDRLSHNRFDLEYGHLGL